MWDEKDISDSPSLSEVELQEKLGKVDELVADNLIKRSLSPEIERRLDGDTITMLATCLPKHQRSPMDAEFTKLIGVILGCQGYKVSSEFINIMSEYALVYLHDMIENIKKFTEIQRRTRPSMNDIRYSFSVRNMDYNKLFLEGLRSIRINKVAGKSLNKINKDVKQRVYELNDVSHTEESDAFFLNQNYEISKLVPTLAVKPDYIPSYFPELPPDYTYQSTAEYMKTVTDSEKLRVKLVEESRLTEKSLYNLIGDEEAKSGSDSNDEDTDVESMFSLAGKGLEDIATPAPRFEEAKAPELPEYAEDEEEKALRESQIKKVEPENKSFDVLAYVEKRNEIKRNKAKEAEITRKRRQENIFMQAETYYSPFASQDITKEIQSKFDKMKEDELESAIRAITSGRKKQKAEIDSLKEKVKERETEKNAEKIEFGFNFNDKSDSDSDDDMQDIIFGSDINAKAASSFPVFSTDEIREEDIEDQDIGQNDEMGQEVESSHPEPQSERPEQPEQPAQSEQVHKTVGSKTVSQKTTPQKPQTGSKTTPSAQKTISSVGHKSVGQKSVGHKSIGQKSVSQKTTPSAHKSISLKSISQPVESDSDEDMDDMDLFESVPGLTETNQEETNQAEDIDIDEFDDVANEIEQELPASNPVETVAAPVPVTTNPSPQQAPPIKFKLNFKPKPEPNPPSAIEELSDISDEDD